MEVAIRIVTFLCSVALSFWCSDLFAGVRVNQRACESGYLRAVGKSASSLQTTNSNEQYCLGLGYWFQPSPLPRDPALAARWHEAAATQGHVGAMVALAYQFETGQGVAKDVGRAFDYYLNAARHGSADAMFNLFRLYTTGKGVGADRQQAMIWLEKASEAGSADAKKELARIRPECL